MLREFNCHHFVKTQRNQVKTFMYFPPFVLVRESIDFLFAFPVPVYRALLITKATSGRKGKERQFIYVSSRSSAGALIGDTATEIKN